MKSNGGKKKDGKIADKVREVVAVAVVDVLVRDVVLLIAVCRLLVTCRALRAECCLYHLHKLLVDDSSTVHMICSSIRCVIHLV